MRLAFMGTPDFAAIALESLLATRHEIAAVYTRAPKPRGRGMHLQPSPVGALAAARGLPVRTPKSLKTPEAQAEFAALALDCAIVVAYGLILPAAILAAPRWGCLNAHGSLLPRWRGAAPIQRAIMAGDRQTGVEIMQMTEGLDEGPVLLSQAIPIGPQDDAGAMHDALAHIAARLIPLALDGIEAGSLVARPQAVDGITYAAKLTAADQEIDWTKPAAGVDAQIRGLSPFPGAFTTLPTDKGPVRLRVRRTAIADGAGAPGEALDEALTIACGAGALRLVEVQREGRQAMAAADFLRGQPVARGVRLGAP